jgi:hypothetical protein
MLGVCDRIMDNILQEDLENTAGSMPRRARWQIAVKHLFQEQKNSNVAGLTGLVMIP